MFKWNHINSPSPRPDEPAAVTMAELRERGWTLGLARRLLGKPDDIQHDFFGQSRGKSLYKLARVTAAERKAEFRYASPERDSQRSERTFEKVAANGSSDERLEARRQAAARIDAELKAEILQMRGYNADARERLDSDDGWLTEELEAMDQQQDTAAGFEELWKVHKRHVERRERHRRFYVERVNRLRENLRQLRAEIAKAVSQRRDWMKADRAAWVEDELAIYRRHGKPVNERMARPVVSDRGERFDSASKATLAIVGHGDAGRLVRSIRTGQLVYGRRWRHETDSTPASWSASPSPRKRYTRRVVDGDGAVYESLKAAAEKNGIDTRSIRDAANRGTRAAGKTWQFVTPKRNPNRRVIVECTTHADRGSVVNDLGEEFRTALMAAVHYRVSPGKIYRALNRPRASCGGRWWRRVRDPVPPWWSSPPRPRRIEGRFVSVMRTTIA